MMVGKPAPLFTLPDESGRQISLEEFRGKKNVILIFYPLDWTPV
jgi:peroxiredoxin